MIRTALVFAELALGVALAVVTYWTLLGPIVWN